MELQAEFDPNGLPSWLTGGDPSPPKQSKESKTLMFTQFDVILPRVLECLCGGATLSRALQELPIEIHPGAFVRWLKTQPEKYNLYKEAKEVRTEVWAGKIIDHATADDSCEDVGRSRLIVDAYKWLMGADNRKVYGDTKMVEINSSISITTALEQARARVINTVEADIIDAPYQEMRLLREGDDD